MLMGPEDSSGIHQVEAHPANTQPHPAKAHLMMPAARAVELLPLSMLGVPTKSEALVMVLPYCCGMLVTEPR